MAILLALGLLICQSVTRHASSTLYAQRSPERTSVLPPTRQTSPPKQSDSTTPSLAGKPLAGKRTSAAEIALERRVRAVHDTLLVFHSPRSLQERVETLRRPLLSFGLTSVFSLNGFGVGLFAQREISEDIAIGLDALFSGRQTSDEWEVTDYHLQRTIIPDKLNRLNMIPIMASFHYRFAPFEFWETMRPYAHVGLGGTLIVATPYIRENVFYDFFSSFSEAQWFGRLGGFIGIGAYFTGLTKTTAQISLRYYVIPFGGNGLESMSTARTGIPPIQDFGGLFLLFQLGLKL
jgi:hypothetical protein